MLEDFAKRMRWEMAKAIWREYDWIIVMIPGLVAAAIWLWRQN